MSRKRALATPAEVAEFYQVEETTLKSWRYRGIGPEYTKVNSLIRYDWDEVEAFVKNGRPQVTAA